MGIFKHMQQEIEHKDQQEGITPADLLDLSDDLRRMMNRIIRQGETTAEEAAAYTDGSVDNAQEALAALIGKGYLEREQRDGVWYYSTRFARKRARNIPPGIWSALGDRTKEP